MPFKPNRLIKLREAKGIRTHDELAEVTGLSRAMLWKYENGTSTPPPDALEVLADRLDATMDYFHGRGKKYTTVERAAIEMSFDVFDRETESDEQRARCRRVVPDARAPRTAADWRTLAELIDLAVPTPTQPSGFGVLEGGKR